jgi:mycothiol synthase
MFTPHIEINSLESLLPAGYTAQSAAVQDVQAAVSMFNACSRAFIGRDEFNATDYALDWQTPGVDLANDVRLVRSPAGQLVGCFEFWDLTEPHVRYNTWGRVHPDHVGLGIGTYLLRWADERAQRSIPKAPAGARISMTNWAQDLDPRLKPLLEKCGWSLIRKSYRMEIELTTPPAEPIWPEGITLRTFVVGQDERATVEADLESFRDHWGHVDRPFEDELKMFRHNMQRNNFDPSLWLLAMDGDRIAGMSLNWPHCDDDPAIGWISALSVRREYRRKGLGSALLQQGFVDFYRRGQRTVGLGVDASSLTGALCLYERAGMHVARQHNIFEKELRSGVDLSTQSLK